MRHRAATAFLERQTRLTAVQSLYLALLIDAQNDRMLGWIQIQADMSVSFSVNCGSVLTLNVRDKWGLSP